MGIHLVLGNVGIMIYQDTTPNSEACSNRERECPVLADQTRETFPQISLRLSHNATFTAPLTFKNTPVLATQ